MRAGFYIDGFNVYHAVDDLGKPWLKWSCYLSIAKKLLRSGHRIEHVKLFTAYATWKPQSQQRHTVFVAAQRACGVQVIFGMFKEKTARCRQCGATWKSHEEKESDVNLACHLLKDALQNKIDVAYVITTDSDLAAALRMVKSSTKIEIIAVSTPGRKPSKELTSPECSTRRLSLSESQIEQCLLPSQVFDSSGKAVARRPSEYDPPSV